MSQLQTVPIAVGNVEIETKKHLEQVAKTLDLSLMLVHQITSKDIELQATKQIPFSIAWFGPLFKSQLGQTQLYIKTMKPLPSPVIRHCKLLNETRINHDLKQKIDLTQKIMNIRKIYPKHQPFPQWSQCKTCNKWRIVFVPKEQFPLNLSTYHWTCDKGVAPSNTCTSPQDNPTHPRYSTLQLQALSIQRQVIKNDNVVTDAKKIANKILDRLIRKCQKNYCVIKGFMHWKNNEKYYGSYTRHNARISIHELKQGLEQKLIKSLREFIVQLRTMFAQALACESMRKHAVTLHKYCGEIMKDLRVASDIVEIFTHPIISCTNPNNTIDTPLLQVASTEYKSNHEVECMPALEKEQVDATHNTTDTTNTSIDTPDTMSTNHNNKSSDTDTDSTQSTISITQNHDDTPSIDANMDANMDASDDKPELAALSLQVAMNPHPTETEDTFECVQAFPVILRQIKIIINQIKKFDKSQAFFKHVQTAGYRDIVQQPIHFGEILDKIDRNEYDIMREVLDDISLIWSNCYLFNGKPDVNKPELCGFANYASELQWALDEYMKQLKQIVKQSGYMDDNKIQRICTKLGLGKISVCRVYHFSTRLEVYQCIERLFETYDAASFATFIHNKKSHFCRDMKNGMNVKGPVIPLTVIRNCIIERFRELKYPSRSFKSSAPEIIVISSASSSVTLHNSRSATATRSNTIMDTDTDTEADERKQMLPQIMYTTDEDAIKKRDGLQCPKCCADLQFIPNGIHHHCFAVNNYMRCIYCKVVLSNKTDQAYYHCIDGCIAHESESKHQYYLCQTCAAQYCDSPQKYLRLKSAVLAFNGVWICLDGDTSSDIMIMLQDSNRISWKYKRANVYQSEQVFHGSIEEINDSKHVVLDIENAKNMKYKSAMWEYRDDANISLTFNDSNHQRIYHKLAPLCTRCKCHMQCLLANMYPNKSDSSENLECCNDFDACDFMQFSTLKAMNYAIYHEHITRNDFYFYCAQCNEYALCAGCVLVQYEIQMNERKNKQKECCNLMLMDIDSEIRDNDLNEEDARHERKLSKLEHTLRQKIKQVTDRNHRLELERDYWKNKHAKMSRNMQKILQDPEFEVTS